MMRLKSDMIDTSIMAKSRNLGIKLHLIRTVNNESVPISLNHFEILVENRSRIETQNYASYHQAQLCKGQKLVF